MKKLREFMKGRPHDKEKDFEEAVIEYIKQLEETSIKRSEEIKELSEGPTINEDELVGYVMRNTSNHMLDYEEVRDVLDAEMDYLIENGIAEK